MFRRKSRKRTVKGVLRRPMATKKFERALERATDQTLLETDWDAIIECVDLIRGKEVPAKPALQMIRKKIHAENPHTALHALHVLEATVKNCGERVHSELASREVMEDVKNLAFDNTPEKVKEKVLELMQCWAMAFANKPEYKLIVDTHNLMKLAGCEFPSIKESDAMFAAAVAPDWVEGDECYRCRSAFGILTRKHHCRACGQIFCDKCSSKSAYLPQFGIEKLVRVCDACFEKTSSAPSALTAAVASSTVPGAQKTKDEERAKAKAQEEAKRLAEQEEEELQLALAISQSEAEAKAKDRERARSMGQAMLEQQAVTHSLSNFSITSPSPAPPASQSNGYRGAAPSIAADEPEDPLARYLNREYWQARHDGGGGSISDVGPTAPSAPLPSISLTSSLAPSTPTLADPNEFLQRQPSLTGGQPQAEELMPNAELDETLDFCRGIKSQVDTLTTRIRSNALRGRSLLSDPSIQTLFTRLTERHGEVLARLNNLDQERTHYEHVQDLVGHIHEAREAMNYLREEHAKQEAERLAEEKRRRDIALQQQLAHVRTLKQEMLVQQRNTALQRFQQQELEMQARRAMAMGYGQPGYPPQIPQGMPQMPVSSLQNLPVTSAQQYGQIPQQPYAPQQQQQQVPPPQHQNGYAPYPPSTTGYPPQQPPAYTASAPGYYQPQPQHQQQQQPQQPLQEQQNLPQQQIHQQHAQAYGYPPQGYQAPQQQYQQPLPKEQPQPVYNQQPQIPQQQHQQQQYYQQPAPGALPYGQPPQNNMQQQYQVPHQPAPPPVVEEASLISFD